jgi:2-oxoglutarate ferredoxin oxidoreductase subunit beta
MWVLPKSYDYVREHVDALSMIDYVPEKSEISINYEEGDSKLVELHDGSHLNLHKLNSGWDPTDKTVSFKRLHEAREKHEILTGLIYIDPGSRDLHDVIKTVKAPLNTLKEKDLIPGNSILQSINAENR